MGRRPVIAVVGSGDAKSPDADAARLLGRLIAERGWILITGGRDAGVMRAANEGAKEVEGSITIGILPNGETVACEAVDVPIITDMGEARNNLIVRSAGAVVACGLTDAGTLSEVALAIKAGKPVVVISSENSARSFINKAFPGKVKFADSPKEALSVLKGVLPGQ